MVTKFSFNLYSPSELTLHRASCIIINRVRICNFQSHGNRSALTILIVVILYCLEFLLAGAPVLQTSIGFGFMDLQSPIVDSHKIEY